MKKQEHGKQPNMDGINLLVSLLVCYQEISMVSFDPAQETLDLSFTLSEIPQRSSFETVTTVIIESIEAYHALEHVSAAVLKLSLEAQGSLSFLHIIRDVDSLSRGEISLIVTLLQEYLGDVLLSDDSSDAAPEAAEPPHPVLHRRQ